MNWLAPGAYSDDGNWVWDGTHWVATNQVWGAPHTLPVDLAPPPGYREQPPAAVPMSSGPGPSHRQQPSESSGPLNWIAERHWAPPEAEDRSSAPPPAVVASPDVLLATPMRPQETAGRAFAPMPPDAGGSATQPGLARNHRAWVTTGIVTGVLVAGVVVVGLVAGTQVSAPVESSPSTQSPTPSRTPSQTPRETPTPRRSTPSFESVFPPAPARSKAAEQEMRDAAIDVLFRQSQEQRLVFCQEFVSDPVQATQDVVEVVTPSTYISAQAWFMLSYNYCHADWNVGPNLIPDGWTWSSHLSD